MLIRGRIWARGAKWEHSARGSWLRGVADWGHSLLLLAVFCRVVLGNLRRVVGGVWMSREGYARGEASARLDTCERYAWSARAIRGTCESCVAKGARRPATPWIPPRMG